MKPKPFSALNHLTVPVAISPPWAQKGLPCSRTCKCETGAAQLHTSENDESPRSHAPQALYCKGNQTATCGKPSIRAAECNRGQDHVTRMFEPPLTRSAVGPVPAPYRT